MTGYRWRFTPKTPGIRERNPIAGEFFSTEATDRPGEALVREGIQNSLDAAAGEGPVMVRMRVSGERGACSRAEVSEFLEGLEPHLTADSNGLRPDAIPGPEDSCPFLVFEDFGTVGLTGDTGEDNPQNDADNNFYYFFRAEGSSAKEGKRGTWGVGKQVFPRSSRINSIFGLTVRADDGRKLVMGMSVLKSHDVNGQRYMPDGWFGGSEGLTTVPIDDEEVIDKFCKAFDVQRGDKETGLTIVVPWCQLDVGDSELREAVLQQYFWPILKGKLEVLIEAPGIDDLVLTRNSFKAEVERLDDDSRSRILPFVELTDWVGDLHERDYFEIKMPDASRRWEWSEELFADDLLDEMRKRYEAGERLAIRVPVTVRPRNAPEEAAFFDVILERDEDLQSAEVKYIRDGLIISRVSPGRVHGVRALVVVEESLPMAEFLRKAENPAHTEWQAAAANFSGEYKSGKSDLEFVKLSVKEIVRVLTAAAQEEAPRLLVDYFSIPASEEPDEVLEPTPEPGPDPPDVDPPGPSSPRVVIRGLQDGFVVVPSQASDFDSETLRIECAYDVRSGNAFKRYNPADFDLADLDLNVDGVDVVRAEANALVIRIRDPKFRVAVTGFDTNRDVRVRAKQTEGRDAGKDA